MMEKFTTVDEYILHQSPDVQVSLQSLRTLIITICPDAVESIAYGMPAYKLNKKPLIYFAGYEHHIGLYAIPNTHSHFAQELTRYKQGKGSVQFPLDKPLPIDLIEKMIRFRKQEVLK